LRGAGRAALDTFRTAAYRAQNVYLRRIERPAAGGCRARA